MVFPAVEIAHSAATHAYRANPTDPAVLQPALDLVRDSEGAIGVWHGLQVEDPKDAYVVNVWETIDHHKKLMADTVKYPPVVEESKKYFADKVEIYHVQPTSDPLLALQAPIFEIATCIVNDPSLQSELESVLELMTSSIRNFPPSEGVYGATWGPVPEKPGTHVILVGYKSIEAHMNARKTQAGTMDAIRAKLAAVSNMVGFFHIELHRYL